MMNHFNFWWNKDAEPYDPARVEITLNPPLQELWRKVLHDAFPIAIMQGEEITHPDGTITFKFQVTVEDASLMRQAMINAYTQFSGFLTTN